MLEINIEGIINVDLYFFGDKKLLEMGSYECCDIDKFVNAKSIYLTTKMFQDTFYTLHYN